MDVWSVLGSVAELLPDAFEFPDRWWTLGTPAIRLWVQGRFLVNDLADSVPGLPNPAVAVDRHSGMPKNVSLEWELPGGKITAIVRADQPKILVSARSPSNRPCSFVVGTDRMPLIHALRRALRFNAPTFACFSHPGDSPGPSGTKRWRREERLRSPRATLDAFTMALAMPASAPRERQPMARRQLGARRKVGA